MTITEWCQSPQNRIHLMTNILDMINNAKGNVYCCIAIVFLVDNRSKYNHIDSVGYISPYDRDDSIDKDEIVLPELLPELHKYAKPGYSWFKDNTTRVVALKQAIVDIKSQHNL